MKSGNKETLWHFSGRAKDRWERVSLVFDSGGNGWMGGWVDLRTRQQSMKCQVLCALRASLFFHRTDGSLLISKSGKALAL